MHKENMEDLRKLFIGLDKKVIVNGKGRIVPINFDNAATTPPFKRVLKKVLETSEYYGSIARGDGQKSQYCSDTYEECRNVIESMRFGDESDLFGREKDDSFKGSIGNIYQSFGGKDVYESLEEKAANLLYFVTKNHGFFDGNKRIAAAMFLYFLDRNGALFVDGRKTIDDAALVALTIMIAESRPDEKEMMVSVVMNCMNVAGGACNS